jgi:septal ring factor EnvC (AmiA/AmiB activator)
MELSSITLIALIVATVVLAWLVSRAVAQRRFDTILNTLRERLEHAQREIDERILRIKQMEAQQQALEREIEAGQRRISDLELEIGRLRMRIVDLEARGAPAA